MKTQFLGGSDEVGRLAMVLETNSYRFLFDYGMAPGKPPTFPLPPPPVDLVLLSHAHLDHSGMIPWLCGHADQSILTTTLTAKLSTLLHKDSIKIAKMEGYATPYTNNDIKEAQQSIIPVSPGQRRIIDDDHEIEFFSAGHVPGSLMFKLESEKRVLFTGDFNVIDSRLVKGAKPVSCDILFLEGTYSGREHPPRKELEKAFIDKIDEVTQRGGVAVVPAFAVARSQELIMILQSKGFNIWFDGMGRKVAKIYLKHPNDLRNVENLKKAMNKIHAVHSDHGRKLALNGEVIITSSGMMDGGPVLHYMNKLKNDKKSAVLLTGYQVEGTNARLLREKGQLNFYGVHENVECEVEYFDFSAHAGHSELVAFAKACKPEKIVLFHSEDRTPLAEDLQDTAEVFTPAVAETIQL